MKLTLVLMEPEYEENIGLIARAMKNFECHELILVNPQVNHLTDKALSRAMHAQDILRNAKIKTTLNQATSHADYVVGTTRKILPSHKMYRKAFQPKELFQRLNKLKQANIALVFGRESNGLTNEELLECDMLVTIPTSTAQPSLNVSHAVILVLYEAYMAQLKKLEPGIENTNKETRMLTMKKFNSILKKCSTIDDPKAVHYSFKSLLARAPVTQKENRALLAFLAEIENRMK